MEPETSIESHIERWMTPQPEYSSTSWGDLSLAWGRGAPGVPGRKLVLILRHARSTYNEITANDAKASVDYCDPCIFDAPLAPFGEEQAKAKSWLGRALRHFGIEPQVIITSPLTRALQTMHFVLHDYVQASAVPIVAEPLAREAVSDADDLGTPTSRLRELFPRVSFAASMPEMWWYPGLHVPSPWDTGLEAAEASYERYRQANFFEPEEVVDARAADWRAWLVRHRTERVILVVSHQDITHAAVGIKLPNVGLAVCEADEATGVFTLLRVD